MSYYTLAAKSSLGDSFFFPLPQCLLRSSIHPYPTPGAGELTAPVAEHTESIQDQRHLLLVLGHGALHQRPGHSDGDSEGQTQFRCSWILFGCILCSDYHDCDYGALLIAYSLSDFSISCSHEFI